MRRLMLLSIALLNACIATAFGLPFIKYYMPEDYHANQLNYDIETDKAGNVYVANFEGLLYYDHAEWRIFRTPGISRITTVKRGPDDIIWVGGYNYFGRVDRKANGDICLKQIAKKGDFQGEVMEILLSDQEVRFVTHDGKIFLVEGEQVKLIKQDNSKDVTPSTITIAIDNGLQAILNANKGLTIADDKGRVLYTLNEANGLNSNSVSDIVYDGRGQLWGATNKGIFAIQIPSALTHISHLNGLVGAVLSIKSFNGNIYVGTDDGLFVNDGLSFRKIPGINHACWDMAIGSYGLLAATAEGVFLISADRSTRHLSTNSSLALYIEGTTFYSCEIDGIYQMQTDGSKRTKVSDIDRISKIGKDKNGRLWIQNIFGQIWYRKPSATTFELYREMAEQVATFVISEGNVYVVGAEATKPFPYPLFSFSDEQGIVWLTNDEGKGIYRWKDGKRVTDMDRLLNRFKDTRIRAMLILGDEIWLGNDNGVDIINRTVKAPTLNIMSKLQIRSVRLRNDSVLWGGIGQVPTSLPDLDTDDNSLRFTFSLDYTPVVGQTLYRYRLNNGVWSPWLPNSQANFSNLSYGSYTLYVESKDAIRRNTETVRMDFKIKYPFYYRWYMYILYFILLIALIYVILRFRLRSLERSKIQLEKIVRERTAEVVRQKNEIEEKSNSLETALTELGNAQKELIRQEKMATVGKLTQGLIDRILNPMNYINNFSKLSQSLVDDLKQNIEDEKETMNEENYEDTLDVIDMLRGNLVKVEEHGQHTTRILKAMEEMLKDRSVGITKIDLADVLRHDVQALKTFHAQDIANSHINFQASIPEGPMLVNANADLLSKSVMSMLANAVYAVVKKAQRGSYDPVVSLTAMEEDGFYKVTIRDNGIGIEDNIIQKIFDPFFTTKTTAEASGVGLYLSREIIQNYGGDIHVESQKDQYSEFTITLPILK